MPFRRRFVRRGRRRRFGHRQGYRSAGPRGYVASSRMARSRRLPRRSLRRRLNFKKRVVNAIEDRLLEKSQLIINGTQRISAPVSQQNYGAVMIQNSYADLQAISTAIVTPVSGGVSGGTLGAMKFTVCAYFANLCMKNNCSASSIVDIYCLMPRVDNTQAISTQFATGLNTDQKMTNGDIQWGVTPYMSNRLCTLNRIMWKKRYVLAPGAVEIVEVSDRFNYEVQNERLNYVNSNQPLHFRGLTKIYFAIVRGEPVNDSSTKTNLSTSVCAVDFITSETYYYTFSILNAVGTTQNGTFQSIVTQNSVLIDTGATVTPVQS